MYKDWHIHLENSKYDKEGLQKIVEFALLKEIDEIGIVEYSHRFKEFQPLYKDTMTVGDKIASYYREKKTETINDYLDFISAMKKEEWLVKINFGLEICYFAQYEDFILDKMNNYPFDFYIGSVHHVANVPFEVKELANQYLWEAKSVDEIYNKYYQTMESLVKFGQFEVVGHIDAIKVFNQYPTYDLKPTYEKLSALIKKQLMIVENNSGYYYRYQHSDLGINEELLEILKKNQVALNTASDAHCPCDVGKFVEELYYKNGIQFT